MSVHDSKPQALFFMHHICTWRKKKKSSRFKEFCNVCAGKYYRKRNVSNSSVPQQPYNVLRTHNTWDFYVFQFSHVETLISYYNRSNRQQFYVAGNKLAAWNEISLRNIKHRKKCFNCETVNKTRVCGS